MARDFLDQNSSMFDALGACCTGNDIDPEHPDKKSQKEGRSQDLVPTYT